MTRAPRPGLARALVVAAVASLVGSAAGDAWGQSAAEIARAKQRFREGEVLEARGDCAGAIAAFEQAIAVKETPQLHLRIGVCQESIGRLVGALGSFERAVALAKSVGHGDAASVARDRVAALTPRVPTLTINAPTTARGLRVVVDGTVVADDALGAPQRVALGEHTIRAEAPGFSPFERTVKAAERDRLAVTLELAPTSAGDAPRASSAALPWILVGGGAAALGVGVGLWVAAASKSSDIDALCNGDVERCPSSRRAAVDDEVGAVNSLRAGAIATGVLGLASASVGVALLLRARRAPAPAAATTITWAPAPGPGLVGLGARASF